MGLENTGRTIARLRKKAGLTQRDVAERLGISDKAVSKWERGLSLPDISCLEKLAALLDTETDSLLAGAHGGEAWRGVLILEGLPAPLRGAGSPGTGRSGPGGTGNPGTGPGADAANRYARPGPGAETIIYDKPLVYYPLGLFLLAGVREIDVVCSDADRGFLESALRGGERFGVSLRCRESAAPLLRDGNTMLVWGKTLLYGAGLTKCFELAMAQRGRATVLALQKPGAAEGLAFDGEKRVVRRGAGLLHAPAPVLFLPERVPHAPAPDPRGGFPALLAELFRQKQLYAQPLGRGILEFPLDSWDDVADAAAFVRLVQEKSGQNVCDLAEIAGNRGLNP